MDKRDETREHVLNMLRLDHKRLNDYFFQFDQSNDPSHKLSFARTALNELAIHTVLEEDIFYPFVKAEKPEVALLMDRCQKQHEVVEKLIRELPFNFSDDYEHRFFEIVDEVKQHIQFEEREIFVQLDDIDLGAIAPLLETRRNELLQEEAGTNKNESTPQTLLFRRLTDRRSA